MTWRAYGLEWTIERGGLDHDEALDLAETFDGKLPDDDLRVGEDEFGWTVWVRTWNVLAEGRDRDYVDDHGERALSDSSVKDVRLVQRHSRAEKALQSYGKVRMPT